MGELGILYVTARTWHDLLRSSLQDRGIRAKQSVTSLFVIASPTGRSNPESIIRLYLSDWTASFVTKLAVTILMPLHLDCFAPLAMTMGGTPTGLLRSARNDEERPDWIATLRS